MEFFKGDTVIYKPFENCPKELEEIGKVVSVNKFYVFVVYEGEKIAKATDPANLTLAFEDSEIERTSKIGVRRRRFYE